MARYLPFYSQPGNFSCYIKVLSQMVSPTPSTSTANQPTNQPVVLFCAAYLQLHVLCLKKKTCNFSPSVIYLQLTPLTHSFSIRLSYLTPWERQAAFLFPFRAISNEPLSVFHHLAIFARSTLMTIFGDKKFEPIS